MKKSLYTEHSKIVVKALVEMREKAGLTQRALAEKLGKAHSFVAKYELGDRRIDIVEFYWICVACEASPLKETARLVRGFFRIKGG